MDIRKGINEKAAVMSEEEKFLASYNVNDYERPSVTTDIAVFAMRVKKEDHYRKDPESKLSVLLIRRGEHPYKDYWALPGGFVRKGETIEMCAMREIREETGAEPVSMMPVGVFSAPCRDPRGWVISNAFASVMDLSDNDVNIRGGDDAAEAEWFDVSFVQKKEDMFLLTLTGEKISLCASLRMTGKRFGRPEFEIADNGEFAFDHAKIIACAMSVLRSEADRMEIVFDFLPEKFTLASLQKVQETLMGTTLLTANFRRKIADLVEETEEYTEGAGHRPARLYIKRG